MSRKPAALALCLASVTASVTTNAADNDFYLGLGATRSDYDIQSALKSSDTGFKLIAGVRLLDSFGVEASYADHGKASLPSGIACIALAGVNCPATSHVSGKTTSAFAVGFVDFPLVDLFAKAGLALVNSKLSTPGIPAFGGSDTNTQFAWGMGIQAHFTSLAARAEYEQFELTGNQKLGVVSVSLLYTIL